MTAIYWTASFPTPVGPACAVVDAEGRLKQFHFGPRDTSNLRPDPKSAAHVRDQVDAYFAGERRDFDLPLAPDGTAFQRRVWEGLLTIGYGATMSYGGLATLIGHPGAPRAVGAANGQNPISLFIPCHRVVGQDRTLTGYGGGIAVKAKLLAHEGVLAPELIAGAGRKTRIEARALV
jgi:methylated-DNA-[protein]-cysteine S-methyltransferase